MILSASALNRSSPRRRRSPVVALIAWGLTIEDFLEPNGLTLEDFCNHFRGSWMFGYVEALRTAGVETRLVCISRSVDQVSRMIHRPTGAPVLVLPVPKPYRSLRRWMRNPYGRTTRQTFGAVAGTLGWPLLAPTKELAPYIATPVRTLFHELARDRVEAIICQEYEFPRFDVCTFEAKRRGVAVFGVFQGGDYRRWRAEGLTRGPCSPEVCRTCNRLTSGDRADEGAVWDCRVQGWTHREPGGRQGLASSDRNAARAALGLPQDARVVVWHGRVQLPKKGLDVLLGAWEVLCRQRGDAQLRLLIVGDGEQADDLAALIERSELDNVVFVRRLVHDPAELNLHLAAGDVYAFPSRHEGVPVAPIEAMACGLPVVATDAGGMRDILGAPDGGAGIVVSRDDSAALAVALGRMLDDSALRHSLGRRARERAVEEFPLAAVGRKLRAFLVDDS